MRQSGRTETRRERYQKKRVVSRTLPFEIATVNFRCEDNVAYLIRSAACFGARAVNVIGSIPDHRIMRELSGSTQDLVKINQFSGTNSFLQYIRDQSIDLVSAELRDSSESILQHKFMQNCCIVIGHETFGVPEEIMLHSKQVHIPMPGAGFCLNASQAGNIFMYEISRQFGNAVAADLFAQEVRHV